MKLLIANYKPWNLSEDINIKGLRPLTMLEWGYVYDLHNYINSKYIILVHDDGFIVNPLLWDNNFLIMIILEHHGCPKDRNSYRTPS